MPIYMYHSAFPNHTYPSMQCVPCVFAQMERRSHRTCMPQVGSGLRDIRGLQNYIDLDGLRQDSKACPILSLAPHLCTFPHNLNRKEMG